MILWLITTFLLTVGLIYLRARLKTEFLKSMLEDELVEKSDPYGNVARAPLWKERHGYQLPDDNNYIRIMTFFAPFWPDFAKSVKSKKAIKIEKGLTAISLAIVLLAFTFFISTMIYLSP